MNRWYMRRRSAINAINAIVLARLNGSIVVSGYPKSGTTFLSHALEAMTQLRYLEGSRELALRAAVIHCHFRAVPTTAVFSYRPLSDVVPSFVAHLLAYKEGDTLERLHSQTETKEDLKKVERNTQSILAGHGRLPAPADYYVGLAAHQSRIINVPRLSAGDAEMRARLAKWFGLTVDAVRQGLEAASALSDARRMQGNDFYRRPSARIADILTGYPEIATEINRQDNLASGAVNRLWDVEHG